MIIIKFSGGLGNQMFEYAFYKKQQYLGRKVWIDLSSYKSVDSMPFKLTEAFPDVNLNYGGNRKRQFIHKFIELKIILAKIRNRLFSNYNLYHIEKNAIEFDENYFLWDDGILCGYWQSEKYWQEIKQTIIKDFTFAPVSNNKADRLLEICRDSNSVSLHIRRGDYLREEYIPIFGNICTDSYYEKAIDYFKSKFTDITFIVFSNDSQYVREKYGDRSDFILVSDYVDKTLPDWYEMYLMTQCKHNIIANSTFSWWGAYLNDNNDKVVVAPKRWFNNCDYDDIYVDDWVRL